MEAETFFSCASAASKASSGVRSWRGTQSSPLLFTGQYFDEESGWAYNRFRYYHPQAGVYNAQDPLGASPRIASAQGYVDHAGYWVDPLGLKSCPTPGAGGDKDLVDPQTPKKSDAPEGKPHVPKPYNSGSDVVDHVTEKSIHGRPNSKGVFEVNSAEDVDEIWDTLRQGHEVKPRPQSGEIKIDYFELEDKTMVQYRSDSKSGGQTIDITLPEAREFTVNDNGRAEEFKKLKVHVQQQK
ncbi:RHS repeat-associated core domain-containing protein [Corynebacterium cystitidis]|nr:RHS repeat-associated core domain-containing protein [Corynebacterium cystitidis]